jgi:TnpA family transposase
VQRDSKAGKRWRLYIFRKRKGVDRSTGKIKPAGYADEEIVIQQWDEILRMTATIKLKEVTASNLFRRLNSYSKQHALYRALKAFGQVPKSLFILQVTDDPVLRRDPVIDRAIAQNRVKWHQTLIQHLL